jgi:hypothetical protein
MFGAVYPSLDDDSAIQSTSSFTSKKRTARALKR